MKDAVLGAGRSTFASNEGISMNPRSLPKLPPPLSADSDQPEAVHRDATLHAVVFVMGSGAEIAVSHVGLWPADILEEAEKLLTQSAPLSRGFSTGIGFIGSFGKVATDALLLSAVEGFVGGKMQAKAGTLQERASQLIQTAAKGVRLMPVSEIATVEDADPSTWMAAYRWPNGNFRAYVYGGEKAIRVKTSEGGLRRLLWSGVEQVYAIRA